MLWYMVIITYVVVTIEAFTNLNTHHNIKKGNHHRLRRGGFATAKISSITPSASSTARTTSTTLNAQGDPPSEEDLERFTSQGEASRKFRRSYFTHSDWLKARADDRFLNNFSTIMKSLILRQLTREIVLVGGIATVICFYNVIFVDGLDGFFGAHYTGLLKSFDAPLLKLPSEPFKWSSSSLSLLLVFRTNTAFRRWDEGRKAWGSIINSSRTAARLGTQWATPEPDGAHHEKMKLLADAVWSFPRSLQYHLLGALEDGASYAADVQKLHDKNFAADLLAVRHKPTRALKEITNVFTTINFPSVVYQVEAEKAVTTLCDALGACERIFTSPPPLFYSRHTARFLVVWIFLLPFCLYEPFGSTWNHLGMIPASILISYFMLGVEELATQMEEPFSILPMEKMTGGIRLSADEHVEWKKFTSETIDRTIESFSDTGPVDDKEQVEVNDYPNPNGSSGYLFAEPTGSTAATSEPDFDFLEPSYSFFGTRAIADDGNDYDDNVVETDSAVEAIDEYMTTETSAATMTATTTTTMPDTNPDNPLPVKELDDDSFEAFLMKQAKNSR